MELFKIQNSRYITLGMALIVMLMIFAYNPPVNADNSGWITETNDGFYDIGNNLQVKIDILDGNYATIDEENLFYNGQRVYIKIDWNAIDQVAKGTSLKLELPITKDMNVLSFESTLMQNINFGSDHGLNLT